MSNWDKIFLNLGRLKQSKRKRVIFTAKEGIRDIKNITSSCGCTRANYDAKTRELKVVYTPKKIPSHLQTQGYYTSYKHLTITYVGGEKEVLTFKAIITT